MKLIEKSDPQYFEVTSDEPYDRHKYKLTLPHGRTIILESYEQVQSMWFQSVHNWKGATIEVIDRKKGFQ